MDFMKVVEGVAGGGGQGGFIQDMEGKAMEYAAKHAMENAVEGEMKKVMGEVSGEGANTAVSSVTMEDGRHVAAAATAESVGGGMFNVTSVVSQFANESTMMGVADSILGKQTGQMAEYEKQALGMLEKELKSFGGRE